MLPETTGEISFDPGADNRREYRQQPKKPARGMRDNNGKQEQDDII